MRACAGALCVLAAITLVALPVRASPADGGYRSRAEELSAYIRHAFWDSKACLYRPAEPPDAKALPFEMMWGNGIQLSVLARAARRDPGAYRPVLETFFKGLDRYWEAGAAIPGYTAYLVSPGSDDRYYDDNAWVALALVEAYCVTRDARYLDRADAALRFVLSGWDEKLGGGIYWRVDRKSKNSCSNAPAAVA